MLKTIFEDGLYYNKDVKLIRATLPEMLDELKELTHLIRLCAVSVDDGDPGMIDCLESFMNSYRIVQKAISNGKYKEVNSYAAD